MIPEASSGWSPWDAFWFSLALSFMVGSFWGWRRERARRLAVRAEREQVREDTRQNVRLRQLYRLYLRGEIDRQEMNARALADGWGLQYVNRFLSSDEGDQIFREEAMAQAGVEHPDEVAARNLQQADLQRAENRLEVERRRADETGPIRQMVEQIQVPPTILRRAVDAMLTSVRSAMDLSCRVRRDYDADREAIEQTAAVVDTAGIPGMAGLQPGDQFTVDGSDQVHTVAHVNVGHNRIGPGPGDLVHITNEVRIEMAYGGIIGGVVGGVAGPPPPNERAVALNRMAEAMNAGAATAEQVSQAFQRFAFTANELSEAMGRRRLASRFDEVTTPPPKKDPRTVAYELLERWLNPAQLYRWKHSGWFDVRGSEGGIYTVHNSGSPNVEDAKDAFCLVMNEEGMPRGDLLLTQKLLIENDEPRFRKTAHQYNKSDVNQGRPWFVRRRQRETVAGRLRVDHVDAHMDCAAHAEQAHQDAHQNAAHTDLAPRLGTPNTPEDVALVAIRERIMAHRQDALMAGILDGGGAVPPLRISYDDEAVLLGSNMVGLAHPRGGGLTVFGVPLVPCDNPAALPEDGYLFITRAVAEHEESLRAARLTAARRGLELVIETEDQAAGRDPGVEGEQVALMGVPLLAEPPPGIAQDYTMHVGTLVSPVEAGARGRNRIHIRAPHVFYAERARRRGQAARELAQPPAHPDPGQEEDLNPRVMDARDVFDDGEASFQCTLSNGRVIQEPLNSPEAHELRGLIVRGQGILDGRIVEVRQDVATRHVTVRFASGYEVDWTDAMEEEHGLIRRWRETQTFNNLAAQDVDCR